MAEEKTTCKRASGSGVLHVVDQNTSHKLTASDNTLKKEQTKRLYREYADLEVKPHWFRVKIVEINHSLFYSIASKIILSGSVITVDDLVNEAVLRILDKGCLDKYDPDKGEFSSYATKVLKNDMIRDVQKSVPVKLTNELHQTSSKLRKREEQICKESGYHPEEKEVLECLVAEGVISPNEAERYEKYHMYFHTCSLDMTTDTDCGGAKEKYDFIASPFGISLQRYDKEIVQIALANARLSSEEKMILTEHFGLADEKGKSISAIVREHGLSDYYCRRAFDRAKKKIRDYLINHGIDRADDMDTLSYISAQFDKDSGDD